MSFSEKLIEGLKKSHAKVISLGLGESIFEVIEEPADVSTACTKGHAAILRYKVCILKADGKYRYEGLCAECITNDWPQSP
jgi:hypothetical protein